MKIITVPKPLEKISIVVLLPAGIPGEKEITLTFGQWLQTALDQYLPLGKGPKAQRQAAKIAESIEQANGAIRLEDADFEVVKAAVETFQFQPKVNRHAGLFWAAIENVQETKA